MSSKMSEATASKHPLITSVVAKSADVTTLRQFLAQARPIDDQREEANRIKTGTEEMWKTIKTQFALHLQPPLGEARSFRDPESGYVVVAKRSAKDGKLDHDKFVLLVKQFMAQHGFDDATIEMIMDMVNIKVAYKKICTDYFPMDEQLFEDFWNSSFEPATDSYFDVRLYKTGTTPDDPSAKADNPPPDIMEQLRQSVAAKATTGGNIPTPTGGGGIVIPAPPAFSYTIPVPQPVAVVDQNMKPTGLTLVPPPPNQTQPQWQDPHTYRAPLEVDIAAVAATIRRDTPPAPLSPETIAMVNRVNPEPPAWVISNKLPPVEPPPPPSTKVPPPPTVKRKAGF